ncbi:MAG TPA: DoxX family protein [Burkholderiales bacterium]|nr:DoxX family protein [Burkholderiales bacterium]
MTTIKKFGPLVARILLAVIFIISGLGKIMGFQGTAGYIQSAGLPAPQLLTVIAIIVELGGGILLVIGWKARWAAAALFVFTFLAGLFFHAFWAAPADQAMMQQIQFMKNLAIMGGMLYVVVYGSGPLSAEKAS